VIKPYVERDNERCTPSQDGWITGMVNHLYGARHSAAPN